MNEIDYSKWYGSRVCPVCVKKLEEDDIGTGEVKISRGFGFSNKVKTSYCKECGSPDLIFPSPTRVVLGSIATTIFMSGLFGLLMLGANDTSTFAITGAVSTMVIATLAIIGIFIYHRSKSKKVIKKIESAN